MGYRTHWKRIIDFISSLVLLMILLPLILVITLLLIILNRGKAFFIQERPGMNEKVFRLFKFKTMRDTRDEQGKLLPDDQRMTRTGKIIRSLSLDELPQLINVLAGNMSLVGPRPLLVRYLSLYSKHQSRRHEVRPGITGWAQINGRNILSWEERFEHDIYYVEHLSFLFDLKIIARTIRSVLRREGIYPGIDQVMKPFKGTC